MLRPKVGRLEKALILRSLTLAALSVATGCAVAPQTASNPENLLGAPISPLLGSTPAVLNAEFGQPALLRVDGTAQVWLYHTSACGLNLILYPDASGVPRVAMASTIDGSSAPGSCATSLSQTHIEAGASGVALEHAAAS